MAPCSFSPTAQARAILDARARVTEAHASDRRRARARCVVPALAKRSAAVLCRTVCMFLWLLVAKMTLAISQAKALPPWLPASRRGARGAGEAEAKAGERVGTRCRLHCPPPPAPATSSMTWWLPPAPPLRMGTASSRCGRAPAQACARRPPGARAAFPPCPPGGRRQPAAQRSPGGAGAAHTTSAS
jgi:hypothetical protein